MLFMWLTLVFCDLLESTSGQPTFVNECNNSNVQRNLNNLQEFNKNISNSGKQGQMPKNGYISSSQQKLEGSRTELLNQMKDFPDDLLLSEPLEKHSHSSKKHKKIKKHKLHVNEDYHNEEQESNGVHIQPNAVATDNIAVVDSSEKLVPKIILSRNTEDCNEFIVKENSTNSDNSLKRRRSIEDSSQMLHDGKRSKSGHETNDGMPILLVPSIPIKLDRRLSVHLEDPYGEYKCKT